MLSRIRQEWCAETIDINLCEYNTLRMSTLTELVSNKLTDKHTTHSYIEVYDQYFASRKTSAKNVLEVGIFCGGSILLWQEYFTNAEVTGMDIDTNNNRTDLNKDRIRLIIGDAYSKESIDKLSDRKYDMILDDGPHTLESMKYIATHYTPLLADDGILVIEDVQHIDWVDQIRLAFPEDVRDKVQVVDRREVKGRYDDILVILDLSA